MAGMTTGNSGRAPTITELPETETDGVTEEEVRRVIRAYGGEAGRFAVACWSHINRGYFDNALPQPMVLWTLTPHGGQMAYTLWDEERPPNIIVHLVKVL